MNTSYGDGFYGEDGAYGEFTGAAVRLDDQGFDGGFGDIS